MIKLSIARFLLTIAAGLISSATARADQTQILIKSWHSKNLICRGSLDQAISDKACEERLLYDKKLAALGWCYGKRDQPGNLHVWHVCEPNSEDASAALTMGARPGGRVVLVD